MQINIYIQPERLATTQKKTHSLKPVSANKSKQQKKRTIYNKRPIDTLPVIGIESDLTPESDGIY